MRSIFPLILLCCSVFASTAFAQNKKNSTTKKEDPTASLKLQLIASRETRQMLGYDSIYNQLQPKVMAQYIDKNGQYHTSYTYIPSYNVDKNYWFWDKLPYGICILEVDDPAFGLIRDTVLFNQEEEIKIIDLKPEPPLYTYENGKKYEYLCGALKFNNTLIVHFDKGDESKNREDLLKLLPNILRIQKTIHANVFYVTLPYLQERSANDLLADKRLKRKKGHEQIYMGLAMTNYIELIQSQLPKVKYINPTFFDNKTIEEKMINSKDVKKSDKLVRKELLDLSN